MAGISRAGFQLSEFMKDQKIDISADYGIIA